MQNSHFHIALLKEYFSKFGNVLECVLHFDRDTGKSRGFGFVEFDSEDTVEYILAHAKEHKILDKWIDCKKAAERPSVPPKALSTSLYPQPSFTQKVFS